MDLSIEELIERFLPWPVISGIWRMCIANHGPRACSYDCLATAGSGGGAKPSHAPSLSVEGGAGGTSLGPLADFSLIATVSKPVDASDYELDYGPRDEDERNRSDRRGDQAVAGAISPPSLSLRSRKREQSSNRCGSRCLLRLLWTSSARFCTVF